MSFIYHGDEVLLLKAADHKDWAGMYDPIGGHIEKGEDIVASANREIHEETGLIVRDTKLKGIIHVDNFYGKNIMMFVTVSHTDVQEVHGNDEGTLSWVKIGDIETLPVLPDLKLIIHHIQQLQTDQFLFGVSKFSDRNELLSIDFHVS
jgi:8-oxo-dGTP diphosphatase